MAAASSLQVSYFHRRTDCFTLSQSGAIHIVANPIFHEQTKHIEIDFYFVRDAFQAGFLSPQYLRSDIQPVDLLTKAIHPSQFHFLSRKLVILDPHAPT